MSRFTTASFTTASVAGSGGVLDHTLTIPANSLDIARIKITPSIGAGAQKVEIFIAPTRAASELLWSTGEWTAAVLNDPGDGAGAAVKQGWVVPYEDSAEALSMYFRFTNQHTVAKTYDVEIDYEYLATDESGIYGVPEGLIASGMANGLTIVTGVVASKNNETMYASELRCKRVDKGLINQPQDLRTVLEGGSWVPDGVDNIQQDLGATRSGAQFTFVSASQGRWYYVWRLRNTVGWSRWTDGNITPENVTQYVDTQEASLADTGPPADWEVWVEEGPSTGTIVVHASRPKINGNNLLWWCVQVKDGATGSWLALDNGVAPSEVKYDGSAVNHTLSADRTTLTKAASGWGTAAAGDLILLDVRGSNFDVNYCQWGTVESVGTNSIVTAGFFRPQTSSGLRLKVVKPPWAWIGSGYLGDQDNAGMWPSGNEATIEGGLGLGWIGGQDINRDVVTQEFVTTPINVPTAVVAPEARVWFENIYCRSDDNTYSSGMSGGGGIFTAPKNFTNFNDRDLWLPVYPADSWGTLTFNNDGTVSMTTKTTQAAAHGATGVISRFRLYPESSGTIKVYAKFTGVTMPVGSAADDVYHIGIVSLMHQHSDFFTKGVSLASKGTTSGTVVFDGVYLSPKLFVSAATPDADCVAYTKTPSFTRPPSSSIVELRFEVSQRTTTERALIHSPIEVRVGGSGLYTSGAASFAREGFPLIWSGLVLFVGIIGNCRITGTAAKLEMVSILNGLGEYC